MIPYGKQSISKTDIKNLNKVLKSNWLTQGPLVPRFEKKIAKFVGAKYAVATNSASSALHISCLTLGLKKNHYFWTSSNSFVASANCGLHCGAKVDFVDIDEKTWNISLELLIEKLKFSKKKNKSYWYYEQQLLGFNYKMNELEASLGLSQLKKLTKFVKRRNQIARIYNKLLKDLPIQLPFIKKLNYSTFHLFVIRFNKKLIKNYSYKKIFDKIRKRGIGINLHYLPIHLQPYFKKLGFKSNYLINSENYSNEAISLPIYHELKLIEQKKVITTIKNVLNEYK